MTVYPELSSNLFADLMVVDCAWEFTFLPAEGKARGLFLEKKEGVTH